jgi:transposase
MDQAVLDLSQTARYAEPVKELRAAFKGVGTLTAMVFLTEMGDLRRFSNRKRVGAFLGLAPSAWESGEADDRKGRITRQGPPRVTRILCQATWSRVRLDPETAKAYGKIVLKTPKAKRKAVVAMMRRLAVRMWHVGRDAQVRVGSYTGPAPTRA